METKVDDYRDQIEEWLDRVCEFYIEDNSWVTTVETLLPFLKILQTIYK